MRILLRNGISCLEARKRLRAKCSVNLWRDGDHHFTQKKNLAVAHGNRERGSCRSKVAKARERGEGRSGGFHKKGNQNRVGRVPQGWCTDSEFTGPRGVSLDLKFDDAPRKPSFTELVPSIQQWATLPARAMPR